MFVRITGCPPKLKIRNLKESLIRVLDSHKTRKVYHYDPHILNLLIFNIVAAFDFVVPKVWKKNDCHCGSEFENRLIFFIKISAWNYNFWQPNVEAVYRDKLDVLLVYYSLSSLLSLIYEPLKANS